MLDVEMNQTQSLIEDIKNLHVKYEELESRHETVTAPKLGYQFLCCYSLLALIFKIFSWVCWMTLRKFCHFQPFKILLMSFSVGKTSFASAQFLLNPNSKFLEFGYALVITKEPPFSLFCWSSQLIPEIILSFLTLDMQKYC